MSPFPVPRQSTSYQSSTSSWLLVPAHKRQIIFRESIKDTFGMKFIWYAFCSSSLATGSLTRCSVVFFLSFFFHLHCCFATILFVCQDGKFKLGKLPRCFKTLRRRVHVMLCAYHCDVSVERRRGSLSLSLSFLAM